MTRAALLRGRYRLQARIGLGGSSAVFRARDVTTNQLVAIKQLATSAPGDQAQIAREAHLLSRLSHRGLPSIVECFTERTDTFLVMTYVPGTDLAQRLARRATGFALRSVLAWADDLLDVLMYIHACPTPIVHRDVKPRNVKLDASGRAVLLDFGLAKQLESTHGASVVGYTLRYAPLEQIRGERTDVRSDLFAFGATLYELLARSTPVDAVERAAVIGAGAPDPLPPLRKLAPAVPESVAGVIMQTLALHPGQRPATARVVRTALQEALDGPVTIVSEASTTPNIAPPQGTVTCLATQVLRDDATPHELAEHDIRLRRAIDARDGIIVRADGMLSVAVFSTAEAAVSCAVEVQRALRSLQLRAAVDSGVAELRHGEYVSPPLVRVVRLLEAVHAGQIALSEAARALVRDRLPADATLADLGAHLLRDIADPEHVFQLDTPDRTSQFPPLQTRAVRGPVLGDVATRPIGRDRELVELVELVRYPSTRLVTLVGPGGVGKTCLARLVAETLLDDFPDGVYVVPLATVHDPELVSSAIAQVIGALDRPGGRLLDAISAHVGAREVLLVLDNCEQVLPAAAVVEELLRACPNLRVLATSRTLLAVPGERELALAPLAFPDPERLPRSTAELMASPAIELFVRRARAVTPDFVLDADSAEPIARICARLDGLPLAIELAAARSDLFAPEPLLHQMERGLSVLTARVPDRSPRQQTLRAAFAWSFELLSSEDRRLLAALGAFVGGWDLESADAVCRGDLDSGLGVADGLARLRRASLIRLTSGARFEMLETTRQFTAELLDCRPDGDTIRERHARYFADIAETGDAQLGGQRMDAWVARLAAEHPNMRAALAWFEAAQRIEDGLRLTGALWRFWQLRGHVAEGRGWLERMLRQASSANGTAARARALVGAGALAWRAQDPGAAYTWLVQARDACAATGEQAGFATALKYLGVLALKGPPPDFALAAEYFEGSLRTRRHLGDRDGIASCLNDLAVLALDQAEYARARTLLDESLTLCRALGNKYGTSFVLNNLSLLALNEGAYERVPALLRESLDLARALGSREKIACALTGFASLASVSADPRTAARLFGAADALREAIGVPMSPAEQAAHDRHLALSREALDQAEWTAAVDEGRGADVDALLEVSLRTLAPAFL